MGKKECGCAADRRYTLDQEERRQTATAKEGLTEADKTGQKKKNRKDVTSCEAFLSLNLADYQKRDPQKLQSPANEGNVLK